MAEPMAEAARGRERGVRSRRIGSVCGGPDAGVERTPGRREVPRDGVDDDRIELKEPNLIPLGREEAAEAVLLLAALMRAAKPRPSDFTFTSGPASTSRKDLAGGSPLARGDNGKARSPESPGGGW